MVDILYELGISPDDFVGVGDTAYDIDEIIEEVKSWD